MNHQFLPMLVNSDYGVTMRHDHDYDHECTLQHSDKLVLRLTSMGHGCDFVQMDGSFYRKYSKRIKNEQSKTTPNDFLWLQFLCDIRGLQQSKSSGFRFVIFTLSCIPCLTILRCSRI